MERDYVYSLICELAEQSGLDVRDYADQLYAERALNYGESVPSELLDEIKESRKYMREEKSRAEEQKKVDGDIELFRELFPEVSADSIPSEVWDEVGKGASLTGAYAIFQRKNDILGIRAENFNKGLEKTAPINITEGDGESFITSGDVESMSPAEIKKNYKKILLSLKKWN